ncbi:MAG: DUF6134 family protein [Nitrococcus sp.]|nr:DUF6134 family protein [Nitrococcus sp.]
MRRLIWWLAAVIVLGLIGAAAAADKTHENHFASIRVDGKKIGQVHYTVTYDAEGEVESLKTNASYSVLGFEVYSFSDDLTERWRSGELQALDGYTNDDGDKYLASIQRKPDEFAATLNGKNLTLPPNAFPNSVWNYQITEQSLLFNVTDLRLMNVKVSKRDERIKVDGKSFDAERFDFTGDWRASLWFDQDQQLLKLEYKIKGRDVVVALDQT